MDKSIKTNIFFNAITQFITVIAPLITAPYISRVFNADLIGQYNYCYSIVTIFSVFANMSISIYGISVVAKAKDNKDELTCVFYELTFIKIVATILTLFAYGILIAVVDEYRIFMLIFVLYILSTFFDITWFYQGLENYKTICIRSLIIKVSSVALIYLLVKDVDDMWLYILINMATLLVPNIALWPGLLKKINIKKVSLSIKKHLKPICELLIPGVAYTLYSIIDKTMIKLIAGTEEVGYYEQAYKLAFVGVTIISVFGTVFSSRASGLTNDDDIRKLHQSSIRVEVFTIIPLVIGFYFLADYFIPFYYGEGYEPAIKILKLFSVLPLVITFSNFVSYQYFIPKLITRPSFIITLIALIVNVGLNAILINYYGGLGAAIATLISETLISVTYLIIYSKFQKLKDLLKGILKYLIAGIFLFVELLILKKFYICDSFIDFVIYIIIIIGSYLAVLFVAHDALLWTTITKVKNKLLKRERK